jgi:glycosyltransferase involved in cell wall biosynthesis
MKLVLILMVKNESRILERCLKAVEHVVDAFCIHDTGSTDTTCEIAKEWLKTRNGCLTHSAWQDFGYNRTQSFEHTQTYVEGAGWDTKDTYGLLLDADMIFHSGTLKEQVLTEIGYTALQVAGHLEYPNCRLVRMDHPWKCRGVTHEYWDGLTTALPRSVCWIEDQNDGGCKSDKFERDARLLEKGLEETPTNERYMFYLAQTYHSLGRWKDSIAMYKKRFASGGWVEEQWYSLFMIGDCYKLMGNVPKFEMYMQKAMAFRSCRAEAAYALAKHFRESGQHWKAWHYVLQGRSLPYPTDSLFIDAPVYRGRFDYEATILLFYLGKHEEGLRESMEYMLTKTEYLDSVYRNLGFYVKPLGTPITNHPILRDVAGSDFHPSSVSCLGDIHNVRFVNYVIDQRNGSYTMKQGTYSADHHVRTRNVVWDGAKARVLVDTPGPRDAHIKGLEDMRIYLDSKGVMRFVATSSEFSPKIRMVGGTYPPTDPVLLEPPTDTECEKNWLPVNGTDDIVYRWRPLEVGSLENNTLVIHTTHATPWFFQHLRGSAVPIQVGDDLWALVHYVEYSQPRKYFHCFVSMDPATYAPKAITLPFVFKAPGVEYCLGCTKTDSAITFVFSSWDDNPCVTSVPLDAFTWLQV